MGVSAERKLDYRLLNHKLVDAYRSNHRLLEAVDDWILCPDQKLTAELDWAAGVVRELQNPKLPKLLYRGMRDQRLTDTLDFTTGGWFSKVREELMNKPVSRAITRPVSFTTNPDIALAFGTIVVTAESKDVVDHCLVITNELAAAVCLHRNISLVTQDEVVILPSIKKLDLTLIKPPKPQSANW